MVPHRQSRKTNKTTEIYKCISEFSGRYENTKNYLPEELNQGQIKQHKCASCFHVSTLKCGRRKYYKKLGMKRGTLKPDISVGPTASS